jgi:hypothetical protein
MRWPRRTVYWSIQGLYTGTIVGANHCSFCGQKVEMEQYERTQTNAPTHWGMTVILSLNNAYANRIDVRKTVDAWPSVVDSGAFDLMYSPTTTLWFTNVGRHRETVPQPVGFRYGFRCEKKRYDLQPFEEVKACETGRRILSF